MSHLTHENIAICKQRSTAHIEMITKQLLSLYTSPLHSDHCSGGLVAYLKEGGNSSSGQITKLIMQIPLLFALFAGSINILKASETIQAYYGC